MGRGQYVTTNVVVVFVGRIVEIDDESRSLGVFVADALGSDEHDRGSYVARHSYREGRMI